MVSNLLRYFVPGIMLFAISIYWQPHVFAGPDKQIDFNRDIRPILSDKCYHCHGFDPETREADLRLDVEAAAKAEVDGVRAIVAGDPDESEIMFRILDKEDPMPPKKSNKSLSAGEIDLLRTWIKQGAKYDGHWSFKAPQRPQLPVLEKQPTNPIDTFILAKLQSLNLKHSPQADAHTLIRRATLDLTGVPPTQAEVNDFVNDQSEDAYDRLLDRLLASPRYGERMAQPWLDASRFADTMGYQADWERFQWRWRGWVIDAYNENKPFDQFTIEQLAGDLLPNPTVDQLIATGFNRNHRINDEGGIIPEEYLVEYVVDRVETTSATWMGLTMGCARCHDHKYDPFSQRDFFQLFAYFHNVPEKGKDGRKGYASPHIRVAVRGKQAAYENLKKQVTDRQAVLNKENAKLANARHAWIAQKLAELNSDVTGWEVVTPKHIEAEGAVDFQDLKDGSILATGDNLQYPVYSVTIAPGTGKLTGVRLEALKHPSLTGGSLSPGNGNFVLSEFELFLLAKDARKPKRLKLEHAVADYAQKNWPVKDALDGDRKTGWAVDGHRLAADRMAVFTLAKPITLQEGDQLLVLLRNESKHARHAIGRFRLSTTSMTKPAFVDHGGLPDEVVAAIRKPAGKRSKKQNQSLKAYYESIAPETKSLRQQLQSASKELAAFEKAYTTYLMVMQEMDKPRDTHVLGRGVYTEKQEKVAMAVPSSILGDLPAGAPNNRLGLAQWLVSGKHPLTARVIVNRYWAMLFGQGLVKTVEDFGLQGEYPSHPELLDYLATEYPRIGWDTKQLLKLIMSSDTYKQRSEWRGDLKELDPMNRLLARQSRLRLPAEMVRDQALFASGLLVEQIGGKSVKPYQPEGLWSEVSFQSKKRTTDFYVMDSGEKLYRRSLYTFWKRSMPPPTMATFDAPSREMCILERPRTNTPMQALALMNDVTYVEACRALAEQALKRTGDDGASRVNDVFRTLLARSPNRAEVKVLLSGYQKRLQHYRANPGSARELVSQGESKPGKDTDPIELAALTVTVMTILNMDETINRE